jgi:glutaredoxin
MPRIAIVALLVAACAVSAYAATTDPSVVVFHETNCPDCAFIKGVLDELLVEFPDVVVEQYEVSQPGNLELLDTLLTNYGVDLGPVPILFVGGTAFVHAGEDDVPALRAAIERCATSGCPSPLPSSTASRRSDLLLLGAFVALFAVLYFLQGR